MKVAKRDLFLILLYLLAAIAIFPIVYYLFVYYIIGFTIGTPDRFVTASVALSGPLLVVVGIALTSISFTSLFSNRVHRLFEVSFEEGKTSNEKQYLLRDTARRAGNM